MGWEKGKGSPGRLSLAVGNSQQQEQPQHHPTLKHNCPWGGAQQPPVFLCASHHLLRRCFLTLALFLTHSLSQPLSAAERRKLRKKALALLYKQSHGCAETLGEARDRWGYSAHQLSVPRHQRGLSPGGTVVTVTFVTREGARTRLGLGTLGEHGEDAVNCSPLPTLKRQSLGNASSGGDFPLLGFYSAPFL